jgi:hypothetical protein
MTKQELQKRLKIAVRLQKKHIQAGDLKRAAGFDRMIKETTKQLLRR